MLIGCPSAVAKETQGEKKAVGSAFRTGHFRKLETGKTYRVFGRGSLDGGSPRVYGEAHNDVSDRVQVFADNLDQYEEIDKPEGWEPPYASALS